MSTSNDNKPPFKLKLNLDYKVIFETAPGTGKEYTSEQYGTKSYLYFLEVWDKRAGAYAKERWYASEKQQHVLEDSDLKAGEEYVIVKEEIEGSKAQNFWVYDQAMNKLNGRGKEMRSHTERVAQAMTSDDLPPLEEYLKDPEADQSISSQNQTPINANKTQVAGKSRKDAQTMGMCFKIANDKTDDIEEAKALTRDYYKAFNELMSE